MSIHTGLRRRARGRLARAGVVAVALLASSTLGLASAAAAATPTISLAPSEVQVMLYPVENLGPLTVDNMISSSGGGSATSSMDTPTPVATEWGGAVVVQLPASLDGSAMTVSLDLMATMSGSPTRTYSTTTPGPDQLVLTDLGSGSYRIDLPADDSLNGPLGALTLDNITSADTSITVMGAMPYLLQFTGTGTSVTNVAPQVMAMADLPCPPSHATSCPAVPVDAGTTFALTVPAASLLRSLGLGTLDHMALALAQYDDNGDPIGDPLVLTDRPGLVRVSDPYNATVHLPATMRGGIYELTLVQTTGTAGALSVTFGELQVKAIPPAPRIINAGLRSDTEWREPAAAVQAGKGSAAMVAAGGGMMLLAAGTTAATLRVRRRETSTAGRD